MCWAGTAAGSVFSRPVLEVCASRRQHKQIFSLCLLSLFSTAVGQSGVLEHALAISVVVSVVDQEGILD